MHIQVSPAIAIGADLVTQVTLHKAPIHVPIRNLDIKAPDFSVNFFCGNVEVRFFSSVNEM